MKKITLVLLCVLPLSFSANAATKTAFNLKYTVTPSMLDGSNDVTQVAELESQLLQLALFAGAAGMIDKGFIESTGETIYHFSHKGELLVPKEVTQLVLALGGRVDGGFFYSPVVDCSILDDQVPVTFGDVLPEEMAGSIYKPDPDDPENQVIKTWSEFTRSYDYGEAGCSLLYMGPKTGGNNLLNPPTHETFALFRDAFGGFRTAGEFAVWKVENSPAVEEIP